jgi:hypothetical protein
MHLRPAAKSLRHLLKLGLILVVSYPLFLSAQGESKRPMREWYDYFEEQLPDTLSRNTHCCYSKISTTGSYGINFIKEGSENLVERPRYLSTDFRLGAQTTGRRLYQQLWRYPEWGIGFYGVRLYNDTIFGIPNATFAYVDIPIKTYSPDRKWNWGYHLAGGMSYNFQPNDPEVNPLNSMNAADQGLGRTHAFQPEPAEHYLRWAGGARRPPPPTHGAGGAARGTALQPGHDFPQLDTTVGVAVDFGDF